jgi:hypothetical protein
MLLDSDDQVWKILKFGKPKYFYPLHFIIKTIMFKFFQYFGHCCREESSFQLDFMKWSLARANYWIENHIFSSTRFTMTSSATMASRTVGVDASTISIKSVITWVAQAKRIQTNTVTNKNYYLFYVCSFNVVTCSKILRIVGEAEMYLPVLKKTSKPLNKISIEDICQGKIKLT